MCGSAHLLSRLPVVHASVSEEGLAAKVFVSWLLLVSIVEHLDSVVVFLASSAVAEAEVTISYALRPRARRTCIIAERVPSSEGLVDNTSSHTTKASSTFCMRTSDNAFKAYRRVDV
jgi:hypothetical protein